MHVSSLTLVLCSLIIIHYSSMISIVTSLSTNNDNDRIDPIMRNLKYIVDSALQDDRSNVPNDDVLMAQLSRILEQEEGFRLVNRHRRSADSVGVDETMNSRFNTIIDGSGDIIDGEDLPPFLTNMSIVTFPMGATTAFNPYTPNDYSQCPCVKGDRGDKGDAGICPTNCAPRYNPNTRDCLGPQLNLQRLAQSIRQLIADTKKIAYRNARTSSCICPTPPPLPPTTQNPLPFDYNMYIRLKGDKGDVGTSCSPNCMHSSQTNVRIFTTVQEAMDASFTYPDHTYVHIVNEHGRLQGVFIWVHGRLVPLRLESENSLLVVPEQTLPISLSIPRSKCTVTLPCSHLHIFALGPNVRRLCGSSSSNKLCAKLSDFDDLCGRTSEQNHLKGYYRAFMGTSTQWLANIFAGICVHAQFVNMNEQPLFDSIEAIFQEQSAQHEILDVKGVRPEFQYWWHGSHTNGTTSSATCLDWSHQDSGLSGMASRLSNGIHGLFHYQYTWPCSIDDSNMGILCIETNCDKLNPYKH